MTGTMFGLHMMLAAIELVSPGNNQVVALVPGRSGVTQSEIDKFRPIMLTEGASRP